MSFKKLLKAIRFGKPNADNLSSMAGRLSRLEKKLTEDQRSEIFKIAKGRTLPEFAHEFITAIDEDKIYQQTKEEHGEDAKYIDYEPANRDELEKIAQKRMIDALQPFIGNAKLMERLPEIKAETEQIIDDISVDEVEEVGHSPVAKEKAKQVITSFKDFIEKNKDELTALQAFYNKGHLHWNDLKKMAEKIKTPPYCLTPVKIWQAYKQLKSQQVHGKSLNKISDFVSLLRFELENIDILEPFGDTVDKRFSRWLSEQRAMGVGFTQEQLNWLEKIKGHIAESIEITADDFEYAPFDQMGGLGKASMVFDGKLDEILRELEERVCV